MYEGGEHHHEQHQLGAALPEQVAKEPHTAMPADAVFDQQPVQAYIEYLEEQLGEPLSRRLHEGFRWFLEDALGVDTDALSDDERRALQWLAGWDHWTVENVGKLFNRARAEAAAEARAAEEVR